MTSSIRLDHNQVHAVSISQIEESDQDSGKITFDYDVFFSTDDRRKFAVSFNTTVTTEAVVLELNYVSYFATEEDIPEEGQDSKFFKINAPAIGYPFLRAYVANLMLSSGYSVYMMPTLNFAALAERKGNDLELDQNKKSS